MAEAIIIDKAEEKDLLKEWFDSIDFEPPEEGIPTLDPEPKDPDDEVRSSFLADYRLLPESLARGNEREERSFSTVDRIIERSTDFCQLCAANTDPRKVPVHPGCNCDVNTMSVETGVADPEHPFLQGIKREDANFQVGDAFIDLILPDELQLDAGTVAILDPNDMRFGDVSRWLEQLGTVLDKAEYVVVAVDEGQEQLEEITTATELATDLADRKIWLAIGKGVFL